MKQYTFESLSSLEFEALSRDLLQEELGITLETFAPGRDEGVDARWIGEKDGKREEIIVQCKHYAKTGFRGLLRELKQKEKNKIIKLNPSRYILTTSVQLTGKNKQEILEELSPYCLQPNDIYGRDDLNNLLGKFERVEKQYQNLWMPSTLALQEFFNFHEKESVTDISFNFPALIKSKTEYFTGRLWLRDLIETWFNSDIENHLLLLGVPGFGKTSIAAEVIKEWFPNQIVGYHFCEADSPYTLDPAIFLKSLARMLATKIPDYEKLYSEKIKTLIDSNLSRTSPKDVFETGILDPLNNLSYQPSCFIVIDAVEESILSDTDITIAELIAAKQKIFPRWLRLLVTARDEFNIRQDFAAGFSVSDLDVDSLENRNDLIEFITRRTDKLKDVFTRRNWQQRDVIQIIAEKSNGNFLYATYAIRELETSTIKHLQDLPAGLNGLYSRFFKRHFPLPARPTASEKFDRIKSLLEVLVGARKPLSKEFLSFILSEKISNVSNSLSILLQYLNKRGGKYSLFHKSFNDWLSYESSSGGCYAIDTELGNAKIGRACIVSLQEKNQYLEYAVENIIPHLIAGKCEEELYQLLHSEISIGSNFTTNHIQELFVGLGGHERSVSESTAMERLQMLERVLSRLEKDFITISKEIRKEGNNTDSQIIDNLIMAIIKVYNLIADRSSAQSSLDFLQKARIKNRMLIRYASNERRNAHLEMAAIIFFKFSERYIYLDNAPKARRIIRRSLFLRRKLVELSTALPEKIKHRDAIIWNLISLGNYAGSVNNEEERSRYIEMAYDEFQMLKKEAESARIRFDRLTGFMLSNLAGVRNKKRIEYLQEAVEAYKRAYTHSLDDRHLDYTIASAISYLCEAYLSEANTSKVQKLISEAESHLAACLSYQLSGQHSYERLQLRLNWSKAIMQFHGEHKEIALHNMSEIIDALKRLKIYFKHPAVEKDINRYSQEKSLLETSNT